LNFSIYFFASIPLSPFFYLEKFTQFILHSLKAKQDVTELRRAWGHTILHLIIFIVIFLICLTVVIGFGRNFFKIEAEVLKIIIVGALAEILGLALIVAKFLFGNQSYKS
jgi:hypothetical protein